MLTYSSTLRISTLRLLMKYFYFLFESLLRSLTTCSFTLKRSATSWPVLFLVASSLTILTRSFTLSWWSVRRFLFGLAGLIGALNWSIFNEWSPKRCSSNSDRRDLPYALTVEHVALSFPSCCPAFALNALLIYEADLAYPCSCYWSSLWVAIVNSSSIPLYASGLKSSVEVSCAEFLRICFNVLSVKISCSTSKTVTRWLIASLTFLTSVQYIGMSNMRFDFDGR